MSNQSKISKNKTNKKKIPKCYASMWHRKPWTHVELGAANYGYNPYLRPSKTMLKNQIIKSQYKILFQTVDDLIKEKGLNGVIYINDLSSSLVDYTIESLNKYISKNYKNNNIILKPLVGDFFEIPIPKANSIHLKNPEHGLFTTDLQKNIDRFKYFAEQSGDGLTLTTYFVDQFSDIIQNLGVGYAVVNEKVTPYVFADGEEITDHGNVVKFSIKSSETLAGRLRSQTLARRKFEASITEKNKGGSGDENKFDREDELRRSPSL